MKYQDKLLFLSIGLVMATMSVPAMAANQDGQAQSFSPKPFIGVGVGYQLGQDQAYSHSAPTGTFYQIKGGMQFYQDWRWDLGYQYHHDLHADKTAVTVSSSLFESAVRYDWAVHHNFSLYGRLGVAYWDIDKTQSSHRELNAKGFSPLGEVGGNYHFSPNLDLSLGYQFINSIGNSNTGEYDSHGVLFGLTYLFNHKKKNLVSSK
ncbi:exported hypothetical protein [Vibrio chagasii]|nr:exported hypothetical protein [Vibrio chagasii]